MFRQFVRGKPLQAGKLVTIAAILLYAVGGVFGPIPDQELSALLLVLVLSLGLALVITAEALFAGYRAHRADDPPSRRLTDRPVYTAVRVGEVVIAVLAAGTFVVIFTVVTDRPMAGPGAIGLVFIGVGLGLLVLGVSLVRTLDEYYYHRSYVA